MVEQNYDALVALVGKSAASALKDGIDSSVAPGSLQSAQQLRDCATYLHGLVSRLNRSAGRKERKPQALTEGSLLMRRALADAKAGEFSDIANKINQASNILGGEYDSTRIDRILNIVYDPEVIERIVTELDTAVAPGSHGHYWGDYRHYRRSIHGRHPYPPAPMTAEQIKAQRWVLAQRDAATEMRCWLVGT